MRIPYPKICGEERQQLTQIRNYLYQLAEQLNVEAQSDSQVRNASLHAAGGKVTGETVDAAGSPGSSFNQIKSLIIKSAEIVNAYYEEIKRRLESVYVAKSDFGEYQEKTYQDIEESAKRITRLFRNLQTITGEVEKVIKVTANIQTGLLYYVDGGGDLLAPELPEGTPVYGVEIGQTTELDGEDVFQKFARFTAYGMAFYDENGMISAYITNQQLRIPQAVIEIALTRGGFVEVIGSDGGSVERWVGV